MGSARADGDGFGWIGGHPALDLVNTVEWRLDPARAVDNLPDYGAFLAWAQQAQLSTRDEARSLRRLGEADAKEAARELRLVKNLREDINSALIERSLASVERVAALHLQSLKHAQLRGTGGSWAWVAAALAIRAPRDRVVREVVALMTSADVALLHRCEDIACGWLYLDRSPRHNRRWCSAADCGNRNRARRHYARQKRNP